jgi:hypothetical protein
MMGFREAFALSAATWERGTDVETSAGEPTPDNAGLAGVERIESRPSLLLASSFLLLVALPAPFRWPGIAGAFEMNLVLLKVS